MARLNTIGHSTRTFEELIAALHAHAVGTLVDIRAFPLSRRLPHFNRESLNQSLPAAGIEYVWMKSLGGYRKKILDDSPNIALRNASFRNYADHMLTPEFENAMAALISLAEQSPTAYMCSDIFVVIVCWCQIGWLLTVTRCSISMAPERHGLISSPPKRASWTDG